MSSSKFTTPPPSTPDVNLTFPSPHVLLVTLNRPRHLNSLRREMHGKLDLLWRWYDSEPSLRCAVITGTGRAFCAGADLREWDSINKGGGDEGGNTGHRGENGFGGMSDRRGKKPIIAAVNGLCLGGGMEMVINADMILASPSARFGLPEVTIGVIALAGALPRLIRTVGRQRASEMALLGRQYTAQQMLTWGIVNHIVEEGEGKVVEEALRWASEIANNSPDSVIVSRAGLMGGWDGEDPKASTNRITEGIWKQMEFAENINVGVESFSNKKKAVWKNSKL